MSIKLNPFPAEFFAKNRSNLKKQVGDKLIIISANGLMQKIGDEAFPFRQDGNFWYLTGIEESDLVLVIKGSDEFIICPPRSNYLIDFYGQPASDDFSKASGIINIFDHEEGWEKLKKLIAKEKTLATIIPPAQFLDDYGLFTNPSRQVLVDKLKSIKDNIEFEDLRQKLAGLRMVKQVPEIDAIQAAIGLTGQSLEYVKSKFSKYKYEYEIEADLTYFYKNHGGFNHAFNPIVASGKHTAILHHDKNHFKIDHKGLLILDIGAEVNGFAADISRTYSLGQPSKRVQQIYDAVIDIQKYAFSLLKPGLSRRDYELAIEKYMGEKLMQLGIIKSLERDEIRKYYPHGTSHFLGYDVHDFGDYEKPFHENVVITVEPGIYIREEGIGVRIEDDVVLTKNGIEILSKKIPKSLT